MIKWPNLVFPAINLWNCPRQEELKCIKALKIHADEHRLEQDAHKFCAEHIEAAIKEREFLYYLHSGRFPD